MRILIFGAGAVGTLIGGLLAHAGHQVVFIGRRRYMDAIKNAGLRIQGVWGDFKVPPQPACESVETLSSEERSFDWILITTKGLKKEEPPPPSLPLLSEATLVISCQNGYGNCQAIAEASGWHRTLGVRFITGVEILEPGSLAVTVHGDDLRLGHYHNEYPMAHLESIALTMREASIPTRATDQLEQTIWAKIVYNAALNPLGALLGVSYGDLASEPNTRGVMDRIIEEAFTVTRAHGIHQFWDGAEAYRRAFYETMLPPTAAHYPSMLRDLERGRRTEIDALNGAICRLGALKNVPTPVNETITSVIHFCESRLPHG